MDYKMMGEGMDFDIWISERQLWEKKISISEGFRNFT